MPKACLFNFGNSIRVLSEFSVTSKNYKTCDSPGVSSHVISGERGIAKKIVTNTKHFQVPNRTDREDLKKKKKKRLPRLPLKSIQLNSREIAIFLLIFQT